MRRKEEWMQKGAAVQVNGRGGVITVILLANLDGEVYVSHMMVKYNYHKQDSVVDPEDVSLGIIKQSRKKL